MISMDSVLNSLQDSQVRAEKLHEALSALIEEIDNRLPREALRDFEALRRAKTIICELTESGAV